MPKGSKNNSRRNQKGQKIQIGATFEAQPVNTNNNLNNLTNNNINQERIQPQRTQVNLYNLSFVTNQGLPQIYIYNYDTKEITNPLKPCEQAITCFECNKSVNNYTIVKNHLICNNCHKEININIKQYQEVEEIFYKCDIDRRSDFIDPDTLLPNNWKRYDSYKRIYEYQAEYGFVNNTLKYKYHKCNESEYTAIDTIFNNQIEQHKQSKEYKAKGYARFAIYKTQILPLINNTLISMQLINHQWRLVRYYTNESELPSSYSYFDGIEFKETIKTHSIKTNKKYRQTIINALNQFTNLVKEEIIKIQEIEDNLNSDKSYDEDVIRPLYN